MEERGEEMPIQGALGLTWTLLLQAQEFSRAATAIPLTLYQYLICLQFGLNYAEALDFPIATKQCCRIIFTLTKFSMKGGALFSFNFK
jgi:hypothetical protein